MPCQRPPRPRSPFPPYYRPHVFRHPTNPQNFKIKANGIKTRISLSAAELRKSSVLWRDTEIGRHVLKSGVNRWLYHLEHEEAWFTIRDVYLLSLGRFNVRCDKKVELEREGRRLAVSESTDQESSDSESSADDEEDENESSPESRRELAQIEQWYEDNMAEVEYRVLEMIASGGGWGRAHAPKRSQRNGEFFIESSTGRIRYTPGVGGVEFVEFERPNRQRRT